MKRVRLSFARFTLSRRSLAEKWPVFCGSHRADITQQNLYLILAGKAAAVAAFIAEDEHISPWMRSPSSMHPIPTDAWNGKKQNFGITAPWLCTRTTAWRKPFPQ